MIWKRWKVDKEKVHINYLRPCGKDDGLPYFNFDVKFIEGLNLSANFTKWSRLMTALIIISIFGEFSYGGD